MIYLIKFILLLLISYNSFANENKTSEILFKINNKVFTNIDLEERKEYVALISNLKISEFSKSENIEILDDYISSLIFYEYFLQNKIFFKNLNNEIDLVYKKNFQNGMVLDQFKIKKFKFSTKIDLIRNKIIQEKLNSQKNSLLQEINKIDLLYNYNLKYLIIKENLINKKLINNINDRDQFNNLKKTLAEGNINFFYKEEDINDNSIISNKIKNIINKDIKIFRNKENGYVNLISIEKNLESYEGIFVKLINFKSKKPIEKNDLKCDKLNKIIDNNKTIFKEYEYSKLNDKIKNNLKSLNDFIQFKDNGEYNYIILCELTYDEDLLKNINFNKNVNSLVSKIQKQFLKKYKNEYKFIKLK